MFKKLEVGERCPLNETGWMKRKALFNCTDTSGNPPKEYHCLTNNLDVPGEVCMASGWVQPNYCPVYNLNAKGFDAVPCDQQRGLCSSEQFQSREVFKYPGCLNITRQPEVPKNGTMKPMNFLSLVAVAGVAVATLVVISICCVWYCRRKRGGSGKKTKDDVEMRQPLVETFPSEFHRTCHYLKASVFYPTKVFTKCIGLFDVHGILTFVGPHGSGKTTNAVNLLSKKEGTQINGKKCMIKVCESVDEVESKLDDSTVTCVLLDDGLEQYAYQPTLLKAHKDEFTRLKKFIDEGKLQLICTATETTWKSCAKEIGDCPLFHRDFVVELSEKVLDKHEKSEILKKHLAFNKYNVTQKKKDENLKSVDKRHGDNSLISIHENTLLNWAKKAKVKGGIGIPLLFDMMCVNKHLFASADNVIADSLENILKMRIDFHAKGSTDPNSKDFVCLLLFAAFFGGQVSLGDFRKKGDKRKEEVYVSICSKKGSSAKEEKDIGELLRSDELSGFFYPLTDSFIFHHKVLTPLLLSMIVKEDEVFVLNHAELDVLFKVLQPQKSKYPFSVTVSEKAILSDLIPRIWKEAPNDIAKWKEHVVMQSEKLKKQLENPPSSDEEKKK